MKIDSGDTAWLLVSAALVMLMTPALGFFYGGLVGKKNVLSTLTHSFFILCLISVQWVLWGYSLAFSPDTGAGLIGGLGWVALKGVGFDPNPDYAATVPHQAFMAFQMMFAVITPALITGSFAERVSFKAYVIFSLAWSTLVYDPIAHWVWGTGGWLHALGALDFAGGTVVHISSAVSAPARSATSPCSSARVSRWTTRSTSGRCTASAGPGARSRPASSPPSRSTAAARTASSSGTRRSSSRRSSPWARPGSTPPARPS